MNMTLTMSTPMRNGRLDAIETVIGPSAIVKIRTGAPPATVATASTGTVLATLNLPSDYLAAASGGVKSKSGTWQDSAADAAGQAGHFELCESDGTTVHIRGRADVNYANSQNVSVGERRVASGNVYTVTTAGTTATTGGGPTGTGTGISDGTAVFAYTEPAEMVLDNTNIAVGQQVTITSFDLTDGNA